MSQTATARTPSPADSRLLGVGHGRGGLHRPTCIVATLLFSPCGIALQSAHRPLLHRVLPRLRGCPQAAHRRAPARPLRAGDHDGDAHTVLNPVSRGSSSKSTLTPRPITQRTLMKSSSRRAELSRKGWLRRQQPWRRFLPPMTLHSSCFRHMRPLSPSALKSKPLRLSSPCPDPILGACAPGPPSRGVLGCHGPGLGQGTCRPCHLPGGSHRQPFQPSDVQALPEPFAVFRRLSDPTIVARTLTVQLQYITDVAANMPADTHTTVSGIFRLAWRRSTHVPRHGHAAAHRVYVLAATSGCLPSHPPLPAIVPAVLPPGDAGSAIYLLARWKCECPLPRQKPSLRCIGTGSALGRLLAACIHSRVSPHLLSHSQAPQMRCLVQIRSQWLVPCPALSL